MKVVTTNLLNRFWKSGIKPIMEGVAKKVDTSKIVQSTNITEDGFLMDGKTASEAYAELIGKLTVDSLINASEIVTENVTALTFGHITKMGNICEIFFAGIVKNSASTTSYVPIYKLPEGMRGSGSVMAAAINSSDNSYIRVGDELQVYIAANTIKQVYVHVTYISR